MAIRVLGLNSRIASIEVRELFSFDAGAVEETLGDWQARYPNIEAAFVSTCNRTELYVASERNELCSRSLSPRADGQTPSPLSLSGIPIIFSRLAVLTRPSISFPSRQASTV